ncbi:MAG: hypothetical protein OXP69_21465 [Spirochaetaceae bacterium]|nr:hypothetical protein [Spirochaetaceae bacterium]
MKSLLVIHSRSTLLVVLLACFGAGTAAADTASDGSAPPLPAAPDAEVAYFTPAQTEGPYYPVTKPADRDSDMVIVQGASSLPAGDVVEFGGTLFDAAGSPVAGAVIEIWQTDNNGIYAHPGDRRTSRRDTNFQFYGESVTAADGTYGFRTILPGYYASRPRHIHVKVKLDGRTLLTTQFYFAADPRKASDSIFAALADKTALIIDLDERTGADGSPALHGSRDIVLRM